MSHYAKVVDGIVKQVITAEAEFFENFVDTTPGQWIQTSYNTHGNQHPENRPLRGNFAGIGFTYDHINNVFYAPKPYSSWTLNQSTWLWESPITYPTDNKHYAWDEATTSWKEVA
jgi:hypothetical protein